MLAAAVCLAALALLGGCAGLPAQQPRAPTQALAAPADSPLVRLVAAAAIPSGQSGFWPLPQASFALDARLALIRNARRSLDLQYYLLGDDLVGHLILRELAAAARRGIRVRLLLDDLYTQTLDPLLLALQQQPNVQVRLFNPFVHARASSFGRLLDFAGDFRRLNHRMHNKLFIADSSLAVLGGRNLADEYFLRSKEANFLDMDVLVAGALLPRLDELFDTYWNSEESFALEHIASSTLSPQALQQAFDERTAAAVVASVPPPAEDADLYGQPPLSSALATGQPRFVIASGTAHADAPAKASTAAAGPAVHDTVMLRFMTLLGGAHSEVLIFSPYFIPGAAGMHRLRQARDAGIQVRVVTNALGTSDEPLVNFGYDRYRRQMLQIGVQVYELSSTRLRHDPTLKRLLGSSRGRLHAKMAFIDRRTVLIGSMNMDQRSAYLNTELGIAVQSPELAKMILGAYKADGFAGVYQVQLKPDGSGLQWTGHDAQGDEVLSEEPDIGFWQRFRLGLMFLFVPEDML